MIISYRLGTTYSKPLNGLNPIGNADSETLGYVERYEPQNKPHQNLLIFQKDGGYQKSSDGTTKPLLRLTEIFDIYQRKELEELVVETK